MTAVAEEISTYRDSFERTAAARRESAWLSGRRREAIARFEAAGFPTLRDEAFRHTNVSEIARTRFQAADPSVRGDVVAATLHRLGFGDAFKGREAVFVNGRFAPDLSTLTVRGVRFASLREAMAEQDGALEARLARMASGPNPFLALNTAFFEDAAVLFVEPGVHVESPLHLLHLTTSAGGAAVVSYPRTLLVAGKGSQVTLVESYGGPNGEAYLANAATEIEVGEGAVVDHYYLQRESLSGFHVSTLAVSQAKDAAFCDQSIAIGSRLARRDVDTRLHGIGASTTLLGLFIGDGQQLLDTHTRIDHAMPHGTSRETYKGILNGRARGVFNGLIVVRKDAQKTDALQSNKNLLLSAEALVHSTPQLEIFADDVKCKHGSTTGQLDPTALFYLQSRGISAEAARSLLTFAFASDLVSKIRVAPVRAGLEAFLQDRLPAVPREAVA